MKYFYEELKNGATKSEALRLAKVKFLTLNADNITVAPYYWDSFYILGNDEPLTTQWTFAQLLFLVLGGLAPIALMVAFGKKRKGSAGVSNSDSNRS